MGLLCNTSQVLAQSNKPNEHKDIYSMSIEELIDFEIDTVSTASKYEQKVIEAPSFITIITADDIRRHGYRTLLDILDHAPGFYKTYDRNYGYIGVRGFGRPGDYNCRILLMIDGHQINDNISGGLGIVNDFRIDIDLIDRIEIVHGPGSALYGSNAFFAVINVFTKNGKNYNGLEISSEIASFDTERDRLTYGKVFNNNMDILVSGTYFDSDGQTLYYSEYDDPSTNYGKVKNDDDRFKHFFVKVSIPKLTLTAAHVQREKGIPTSAWDTVFNDKRTRTWDYCDLIGLKYNHDFNDDFSMITKIAYNYYNYEGEYLYDDSGIYVNNDWWKGRWLEGEVQFTRKFSERHKIIWGTETRYNIRQDQKNWDSEIYLYKRKHSKSWGIYAQDEFKLRENLTVYAGLRRDDYDSTGHTTNPRLGFIYKLSDDSVLKFLYGKAFRSPSAYELYYGDSYTQKPNPDLKPETIKTYEVVLDKYFNQTFHITVSGYYNKMKNLIDQKTDIDGWIVFDNVDEVTAKGMEAALEGKWSNGIRSRISYSFVQTLNKTTRATLANSPKHMYNINLLFPLMQQNLFAGIEAKYTDKKKTLTGKYEDNNIVTNLTLTYENILKGLEAQLGIYNLFDIEYGYPGFAEHTQDVINQDGRSVGFRLTYRF